MKLLKYAPVPDARTESDIERHIQQLSLLAEALVTEINTMRAEVFNDRRQPKPIDFEKDGINFYEEVERYEIELIESALSLCNGNQSQAAKLLRLQPTTLNAKLKHYGLSPVRSIMLPRPVLQPHS